MKSVKVEDAVGMVLAHDLTKIVPGEFKGAAFRKGHIVRPEDIDALKDAGKFHVFVVTMDEDQLHENDAAKRIAAAASAPEMELSEAKEGKVVIKAFDRGLLKINKPAIYEVNRLGRIALVCMHDNSVVDKNQTVAAAKIIPLTIDEDAIEHAELILKKYRPVIQIKPFHASKTAVIVTGSEVYYGRIKDKFGAVLQEKIRHYGGEPMELKYAPDDSTFIKGLIEESIANGAEIVLLSGGMAVDADDVTPKAIESVASEIVTYGMPLLPGAMCMIAYNGAVPIIGIPACAMYHKATVLDMIYPRLTAGEKLTKDDTSALAHGGLCLACEECRYPICPFGK